MQVRQRTGAQTGLGAQRGAAREPSRPGPAAEYADEVDERLTNEEYKIWKKNTPFLYGGQAEPCHRLNKHYGQPSAVERSAADPHGPSLMQTWSSRTH